MHVHDALFGRPGVPGPTLSQHEASGIRVQGEAGGRAPFANVLEQDPGEGSAHVAQPDTASPVHGLRAPGSAYTLEQEAHAIRERTERAARSRGRDGDAGAYEVWSRRGMVRFRRLH